MSARRRNLPRCIRSAARIHFSLRRARAVESTKSRSDLIAPAKSRSDFITNCLRRGSTAAPSLQRDALCLFAKKSARPSCFEPLPGRGEPRFARKPNACSTTATPAAPPLPHSPSLRQSYRHYFRYSGSLYREITAEVAPTLPLFHSLEEAGRRNAISEFGQLTQR